MQDVQAWLNNPADFVAGVKLFELHGGSSFFTKLFKSQGPTAYNISKLKTELAKLAPVAADVPAPLPPVELSKNDKLKTVKTPTEDHHKIYLQLLRQRDDTYRQLEHNNAVLDTSKNKTLLFATAIKMKSLWRKLQEVYSKLDYYNEHGSFPDPEPEKEVVTPEMQRLYVSINKAVKRLEKPDCRNREKTELLLKQHRERLQQLKDNG